MKNKVYFTFTFLTFGETFYNPRYVIDKGFVGLDVGYKYVAWDISKDARHLAYAEIDDSRLPLAQFEEILSERLAVYGYHKKSEESALAFLRYVTGNADATLEIPHPVPANQTENA